ncbi:MAG TPA: DNA primase [Humisphaera sp.]
MASGASDVRGGGSGGGGNAAWDDFKSRVMAATDLVELIGRTVALKKMGKDYKGLCPFHQEKTPSFTVNPERGFFYCYGCKKGGDAITFVKERDRVDFKDALKSLATDAGIPMPTGRGRQDNTDVGICLEAHSLAAMFFENQLKDPQRGQAAREYLEKRGITPETAAKFRIGLAPEGWDNLLRGPVGRKFTPEHLHMAGLLKRRDPEKGQGFYDTFRNRLMFPIRDPNGRVIAFGGRVMPGSQDPAKYLNSPETPTFSKSRTAYGLDLARQRIVETGTVVVVEGYTDVVMAHQFGATNVVSILGTAMTEQHVAALRRFASRIVLLFDPDTAGDLAVDRAVSLFLTQPVEIAIANLGEDLDPDEFLLKHGLGAWDKLIGSAPEALAYKWKHLARQFSADDGTNLTGQQKAVETYLDLIAQAKASGPVDPIRWGLVVSQVAKLTGIPAEQLQRRLAATKAVAPPPRRPGPGGSPGAGNGPPAPGNSANNGVSRESPGAPGPSRIEQPRRRGVLSARDRAERWVLGALLLEPAKWHTVQTLLAPDDFTETGRRRLAEVYWNHQQDEGEPAFSEFLAMLGADAQGGNGGQVGADGEPIPEPTNEANGAGLRELAIDVTDEVEATRDVAATLQAGLEQIRRDREAAGKQKLIATLRRSTEQNLGAEQEVDLLKRLQDQIRQSPKQGPAKS